jgi:hypothetical protein
MSDAVLLIVRIVSICAQFFGVLFAALVAWLICTFMADDSWAVVATDSDWWLEAGRRWAFGFGAAILIGGILLVLNRALVHWNLASPRANPARTAIIGASVVAVAATAGAIYFAVERPWF